VLYFLEFPEQIFSAHHRLHPAADFGLDKTQAKL
jgi:hypothetical protein